MFVYFVLDAFNLNTIFHLHQPNQLDFGEGTGLLEIQGKCVAPKAWNSKPEKLSSLYFRSYLCNFLLFEVKMAKPVLNFSSGGSF